MMSILTAAFYEQLINDPTLAALLSVYKELPAVFTTQPIPDDFAGAAYIVTAGEVAQTAHDCKNSRGRDAFRDIRAYTIASGSAENVEAIIERARALFHRESLTISGYTWVISNVSGPIVADEPDKYGRILTVEVIARETS